MTERILTVPNLFTVLRIGLIPFFLSSMIQHDQRKALIIFFIAASTDLLDGVTARLLKQRSKIGELLDPAGDKLLMTAAIIALSIPAISSPNTIPLWLTIMVIGRDLYIVAGSVVMYTRTRYSTFAPTFVGKMSTVCQMSVLFLVLFFNANNSPQSNLIWLYILTLTLTIISGIQYTIIGRRIYQEKMASMQ
ncbi:MAG: CDP-alcohol phosphatidyltransferase family protein [Candidatus Aminicenantes bacterium]|jgi:cardiolipin synthase